MIRWLCGLGFLVLLVVAGQWMLAVALSWIDMAILPQSETMILRAVLIMTAAYVVLMALPFVPGVEIGLTLLAVFGAAFAPLVYAATVTSLMIAFMIGRLVPPRHLCAWLRWLGLTRAADLVAEAALQGPEALRARLVAATPTGTTRWLFDHRYVALALALNTPGNVVFGGGGGLALMAGLSRLYAPVPFLLMILIAVLPVPLLFFLIPS